MRRCRRHDQRVRRMVRGGGGSGTGQLALALQLHTARCMQEHRRRRGGWRCGGPFAVAQFALGQMGNTKLSSFMGQERSDGIGPSFGFGESKKLLCNLGRVAAQLLMDGGARS